MSQFSLLHGVSAGTWRLIWSAALQHGIEAGLYRTYDAQRSQPTLVAADTAGMDSSVIVWHTATARLLLPSGEPSDRFITAAWECMREAQVRCGTHSCPRWSC